MISLSSQRKGRFFADDDKDVIGAKFKDKVEIYGRIDCLDLRNLENANSHL